MSAAEWLVLAGGLALIGLVNWWFFGRWPGHKVGEHSHQH